jgi:hypothetical protein
MNESKRVVRVAASNNFNCTVGEFAQVDEFAARNQDCAFFVNSNVRTPKLRDILKHSYKAVITLNPDLNINARLIDRGLAVAEKVAFYRIKWLPERADIASLVERVARVAPVVITAQRFNSRKTLLEYTEERHYELECARFRLHGAAWKALEAFVRQMRAKRFPVYICDQKGLGCLGCGLCATLNGHKGARIESLNLSTSGVCPYNCPDCYAKAMQKFLVSCGNAPMQYDVIKRNKKQKGATKHIQNTRKAA